jgi:hypothetical protein
MNASDVAKSLKRQGDIQLVLQLPLGRALDSDRSVLI